MDRSDNSLPLHVAVIMDGNGRWAKQRGLPRSEGHREGAKTFRKIGQYAAEIGIKHLTFYAFSTENWSRPETEVKAIMRLFGDYLKEAIDRGDENREKGIRLRFIGERDGIDKKLIKLMDRAEEASKDMDKVNLNIAVNYGGRQEIVSAVKSVVKDVQAGILTPDAINADEIQKRLYTGDQPPVDLLIRPSGEQRLSNFLLWQSAYAEFWYSDVLWPDFSERDFDAAIEAYRNRNRRFGGI